MWRLLYTGISRKERSWIMHDHSNLKTPTMHKMCLRKARFYSEKQALKVAKAKEVQYNCKNKVYYCPLCTGWHITTIKENKSA